MFDVGFSELMLIAVVALIVIGPERLPKVARTMGHLFGRLQRYVNDVKADINREIELDELRKFKSSIEEAAQSIEQTVHSEAAKTETELNALAQMADPHAAAEASEVKAQVEGAAQSIEASAQSIERAIQSEAQPGSPSQTDAAASSGPGATEPGKAPSPSPARDKTAA